VRQYVRQPLDTPIGKRLRPRVASVDDFARMPILLAPFSSKIGVANVGVRADIKRVMRRLDDGDLWSQVQRGDSEAFAVLFERHAGSVYTYCFRRTADWSVAEDLTSVVFLEAWRRRAALDLPAAKVLPWLLGVATNVLRNQRRSLRRYQAALNRLQPLEPEHDFAEDLTQRLADEQRMRELLILVGRLPQAEQEALAVCVWQGLSSADAAFVLDVPEGTVRTRLFRAREHLRELGGQAVAELDATTVERIDAR
jgi:RNA polymerase sigma factor (sigma-70 family)